MKLVKHLSPIPPPYGGVTVHVLRLIKNLQKDGFQAGAYIKKGKTSSLKNLTVYRGFSKKFFIKSLYNLFNETKNYKIIHTHNFFEDAIYLYIIKLFTDKKIVATIHNDRSVEIYHNQNFIFKFFIRKLINMDIKIICVSMIAKKEFMRLFSDYKEIEIIPAYIPKIKESHNITSLSKDLLDFTKSFNKIIVFYASKYFVKEDDIYGVSDVLEMFYNIGKEHSQVGLVFCVSDLDSDINTIKDNAFKLGLFDKIFWQHGPITNMNDLWEFTDVYVRPTKKDGDSLSVREALEMNVSVVASDVAIRPEQVLVYKNKSVKDFSSKVIYKLNENKQINKADSKQNYYRSLLKIYKDLINEI